MIYQSKRSGIYQNALDILDKHGLIYPCNRSRKEITDSSMMGISGPIYPGTCLKNSVPISNRVYALCIRISDDLIEFDDVLQESYSWKLRNDIGDFVLHRADSVYAYQLAVVVDDAAQNITHVLRGADLLDSTLRQIFYSDYWVIPHQDIYITDCDQYAG